MKSKKITLLIISILFLMVISIGFLISNQENNYSEPTSTPLPQSSNQPAQQISQEETERLVSEKRTQYLNSLEETTKEYLSQLYDSTLVTDESGTEITSDTTISVLLSEIAKNENIEFDMSMFHTDEVECSEENSYGIIHFHQDGTKTYEAELTCLLKIDNRYFDLDVNEIIS